MHKSKSNKLVSQHAILLRVLNDSKENHLEILIKKESQEDLNKSRFILKLQQIGISIKITKELNIYKISQITKHHILFS